MNASGRRQRQAANGYSHLAPRQRPGYKMSDAATSARRLEAQLATERRMNQGKKKQKGNADTGFVALIVSLSCMACFGLGAVVGAVSPLAQLFCK